MAVTVSKKLGVRRSISSRPAAFRQRVNLFEGASIQTRSATGAPSI